MLGKRTEKTTSQGTINSRDFLSLPVSEIMLRLGTSSGGLTTDEALERLEIYGRNEIVQKVKASVILKFLSHLRSPVTIILIIAAILSGILADVTDAVIIFAIVLVSVILDFTQEFRAEKAAEKLRQRVASTATTLRDRVKKELEVSELVPGDIIASYGRRYCPCRCFCY